MAAIKRFDAALGQIPGRIENVAQQQMLGTLAERLAGFADKKNRVADVQAEEEGRRMGEAAAAGTIGGVEIPEDFTIRDRAFADGARTAHAAQIQVDIRETVSNLERSNQFDVEGFTTQLDGYRSGLLGEIDEQLKPAAIAELNDYALRSRVRIEDNMFKQGQQEQLASITAAADGMSDDALSAAYLGDEDMLMKKQAQFFMTLDQAQAANIMSPEGVTAAKIGFNDNVMIQNVTGVFDRTLLDEGLDAGEKAFDKFMAAKHRGVDPVVKDKIVTRMRASLSHERARIRSELTRNDAEIKAREKALKRDVDNAEYALNHGYEIQNLPELIDVSRGTKYETDLRLMQIHQEQADVFKHKRPSQQKQILDKTKTMKLSGEEVRLNERLKKLHEYTMGELEAGRGLDLALEQGIISDIPPLEAPGALAARYELTKIAGAHYEQPISIMNDRETDQFKDKLVNANTDQQVTDMAVIVDTLGEDSMPLLENLAKKNAPTFAVSGAMMVEGRPELGHEMMKGISVRAAYPKIIPDDFDAALNRLMKQAYSADQAGYLKTAIKDLYAKRAYDDRQFNGDNLDSGILVKAHREVTGGILTLDDNGSGGWGFDDTYDIEAPRAGKKGEYIDEGDFIDWMESLTLDDINAMGSPSEPEALLQAVNDGKVKLVTLGNNSYGVIRNGTRITNDDFSPFILRYP